MACAIEDRETDSVVITGGGADERYKAKNTVSVYNVLGWQEDLPPLITGRYNHACTSYTSDKGTRVRGCDVEESTTLIALFCRHFLSVGASLEELTL